jgi:hypothetical protein
MPTPTPAPPILLTDPVPQPNLSEQGDEIEWFASTGHTIHGAFLDHWNKNGEAAQFGYPLTEEFVEVTSSDPSNNQLKYEAIQYFEHAIFTLSAENRESIADGSGTQVQVQTGLTGGQVLLQNGYASGSYSQYGYASDYSWISGEMELYVEPSCLAAACGCAYLTYDAGKTAVQFADRTWWSYTIWNGVNAEIGQRLVVFGHLARIGEKEEIVCGRGLNKKSELYIVNHAQMNPSP